ncbi:MAG: polyhydroxyalkanoate synthesis repressor PhaR [Acidobacteriota bacterium]
MADIRIIKRYGNRRLYDTASGGYLTGQDVVDIIRQGYDIHVVDSRTGENVTKPVLINIILEEEKLRQNLLPVSFLLQLIRLQGEMLQDFFQNYLTASLEAYLKTRQEFDRRFREWFTLGAAMSGFVSADAEAASPPLAPPVAPLSVKRQPRNQPAKRSRSQSKRQTERKNRRSAS